MRVLVCGGRTFGNLFGLREELDRLHALHKFTHVIHGYAPGADLMAGSWAILRGIPQMGYKADWDFHGRKAGPMRNQRMLDEGKPDLVVAFPGGKGTADMKRRARLTGVDVLEIAA